MKAKALEIRDRCTFIPVVAIKQEPYQEQEAYLVRRGNYTNEAVFILRLNDMEAAHSPMEWTHNRTMHVAHAYIAKNFDELSPGQVVDVEFILGESSQPKVSERFA